MSKDQLDVVVGAGNMLRKSALSTIAAGARLGGVTVVLLGQDMDRGFRGRLPGGRCPSVVCS